MRSCSRPMAFVLLVLVSVSPVAAQFTPGNVVVSRVDGTSNAANSATLLEFSPLGVPGFTLPLPTAFTGPTPPAGTPLAITESGSVSSSGYFSLQSNGMALTLGGYNAALGTTGVASSAPATINRTVSTITANGVVSSTNGFMDGGNNGFRSVASVDGSAFYIAAATTLRYLPAAGAVTTSTTIVSTTLRSASIFNGSLFTSGSSAAVAGINLIGSAGTLPTAASTMTRLPGTELSGSGTVSPYGFVLFNNPLNTNNFAGTGLNTLYVADDRAVGSGGGLQRYVYNGTDWGTATIVDDGSSYRGLTGTYDSATNTTALFAVTTETSPNRLVSITDVLTASSGTFGSFSTLATADPGTVFRGVSVTPVPEPTTVLAIAATACGICGLIRRKRSNCPPT